MPIESEDTDVRSGTAAEWAASTLELGLGELAVVTDTGEIRVGDGSSTFANLRKNPRRGNATLVAGTVTVSGLTGVAAGDIVLATVRTLGTVSAPKALLAVAGSNQITITSEDNTDTSVVNYVIFKA